MIQDQLTINTLSEILYHQNVISDLTVGTEINIRIFTAGGFDFIQLDFFQSSLTGGRLFGFGGIGRKTGNELLQFFDLLFFLTVSLFHLFYQQLTGLIPEVVVTGIQLDLTVVYVCDLGADFIQEIAVMGNHDHGIFKVDQEFLQPVDGVHIQMVGGLVEKQDVRIAKQSLCQQDFNLLTTL